MRECLVREQLDQIAHDPSLFEETNFAARARAIEWLDFASASGIEAEHLKAQLEAVDTQLFERLRDEIRNVALRGAALLREIRRYVPEAPAPQGRYDLLDTFLSELLLYRPLPEQTKPRDPEMVFYQRTPSRIVLELCARANLTRPDIFYDIGSGLCEVAMLVHLLTDATTNGIEYEPAYCDYAIATAADLNLSRVTFLNEDAREAEFPDGSAFFMYTPFRGAMLARVVERLRVVERMTLFTYGPCTFEVAHQTWLHQIDARPLHVDALAEWRPQTFHDAVRTVRP
jgi:hypothetical protein